MSDQPTALRLADELAAEIERTVQVDMTHHEAAAELRRLHAENEAQAARIEADAALLGQVLETLNYYRRSAPEWSDHDEAAIAALRERLGEKP